MLELMIVFGAALLAAALVIAGATVQNRYQDHRFEAATREVPQPEADELVTELDLLVRRLGAAALLGASATGDEPRRLYERTWEGDLQRRLRRVVFGHPRAQVRAAARGVKDKMWPLFVAATDVDGEASLRQSDKRARVVAEIDAAMVELKRVTHTGVFRATPRPMAADSAPYRPSKLARVLAERTTL